MVTGLAIFLALLLVFLSLPVTVLCQFNVLQKAEGRIRVQWLAGLIEFDFSGFRSAKPTSGQPSENRRMKTTINSLSRGMLSSERKLLWQRIVKFMRDLWRAIRKKDIYMRVQIGLDNPADTGRIWALLGPISCMFTGMKEATVSIEPVFDDTVLRLQSGGVFRIIPLQLLYLLIGLAFSRSVWKAVKCLTND